MKIGNINSTPATTAVNSDRKAANSNPDKKTTTATAAPSSDSSTQVDLSPAASLLSAASADPSFDSAKVDRIAQAIKDGKFSVNHEAIADKLIANAQELLGRSQPSH